jgi:hypothetical protein
MTLAEFFFGYGWFSPGWLLIGLSLWIYALYRGQRNIVRRIDEIERRLGIKDKDGD